MSMSKTKDIKLETTATYQPLSDLNVRFWSQDKNTAELRFIITRNQFPLSLSKENVKVIIALESGSSFISSDDFIIDSEVEGVARYIIPTDFMRVARNVTGQVYVTTLDKEEIIVERQFKFSVSNDLLSDYPSEDKLRYIKTFDDLRNEIASRVSKLESDMGTMEDYVVKVQDTTQKGLSALNDLISKKLKEYNDNHADKLALINTTVDGYVQDFLDQRSYIDTKYTEFQTAVNQSGLVTVGNAESWQKYKLTEDNGAFKRLDVGTDMLTLKAGSYESSGFVNDPLDDAGFYEVTVTESYNGRKVIHAVHSYSNRYFVKTIHTNGEDKGWKELTSNQTDTGWVPFNLINGSSSNTEYDGKGGFKCAYRTVINGTVTTNYIRLNGRNITDGQTIAQIPSAMVKNAQTFPVRTPKNKPVVFITIYTDGSIALLVNKSTSTNEWGSTDYIYGEFSWTN